MRFFFSLLKIKNSFLEYCRKINKLEPFCGFFTNYRITFSLHEKYIVEICCAQLLDFLYSYNKNNKKRCLFSNY